MKPLRQEIRPGLRTLAAVIAIATAIGTGLANAAKSSAKPVVALAFDAGSGTLLKAYSDTLYRASVDAADWQALPLPASAKHGRIAAIAMSRGRPYTLYVGGPGLGVLSSSDAGKTWATKSRGLPGGDVVALTVHAEQRDTVYAYVAGKGIFRSEDRGDHWRLMDVGPRERMVQFVHSNMPGSMQTGWLYAATAKGVARSMDCFCGWHDAGGLTDPVNAVAYDVDEPRRVYAATADALFVSDDGGERWSALHAPDQVTAIISPSRGVLVAAGKTGALFRSTDHGITWHAVGA